RCVATRPTRVIAAELDLRWKFSRHVSFQDVDPLVGDLSEHRSRSRTRISANHAEQLLLELPRRRGIAPCLFDLNQLPQQRCFFEGRKTVVDPDEVPCALERRDGELDVSLLAEA